MSYLNGIAPDCNDPSVRKEFPTLCAQSPEVREIICAKSPWLCQPIVKPSIWEPVAGTVTGIVEPFGKVWTASGNVVEGVGETIRNLPTIAILGLGVTAIFLLTRR